jgi:predicted Fe-Mo cluster-binding NifX family protein
MRLAIAIKDGEIAQHFGHCDFFEVLNIKDNKEISREVIKNPPHQKGFLPNFLKSHDIDKLLVGNLGKMAYDGLQDLGIEVIKGISGPKDKIIADYFADKLISSDEICEEHMHHH